MDIGSTLNFVNMIGKKRRIFVLEKAGEGSYGVVFKGILEGFGPVAIKVQKTTPDVIKSIETEARISMLLLSSDVAFVLRKILVRSGETQVAISVTDDVPEGSIITIYEFADGASLENILRLNKKSKVFIEEPILRQYISDLLLCLKELEINGIAHRDIKPANLMLHRGKIKMIDLGFACFFKECVGKKGTINFLPPEFFTNGIMNWQKADVFAVGMTIISIITNGLTLYGLFFKDSKEAYTFFRSRTTQEIDKALKSVINNTKIYTLLTKYKELILGMIDADPDTRWTVAQCSGWLTSHE